MSPALLNIILLGIQELIKYFPSIAEEFRVLFNKQAVTPEDWEALRTRILSKSYEDFVPDTAIPKTLPPPTPPA